MHLVEKSTSMSTQIRISTKQSGVRRSRVLSSRLRRITMSLWIKTGHSADTVWDVCPSGSYCISEMNIAFLKQATVPARHHAISSVHQPHDSMRSLLYCRQRRISGRKFDERRFFVTVQQKSDIFSPGTIVTVF